ncbi:MAG TPA: hypothetical protein VET24_17540, partial [Actinomycetota bacterium]|nr:hypothetical protein [Actinomycetota bacterium]
MPFGPRGLPYGGWAGAVLGLGAGRGRAGLTLPVAYESVGPAAAILGGYFHVEEDSMTNSD